MAGCGICLHRYEKITFRQAMANRGEKGADLIGWSNIDWSYISILENGRQSIGDGVLENVLKVYTYRVRWDDQRTR